MKRENEIPSSPFALLENMVSRDTSGRPVPPVRLSSTPSVVYPRYPIPMSLIDAIPVEYTNPSDKTKILTHRHTDCSIAKTMVGYGNADVAF